MRVAYAGTAVYDGSLWNLARDPSLSTESTDFRPAKLAMADLRLGDQGRLIWVDAVPPAVFTEPQPKPLRRIQFRGIRRQ
jgi:hypothetical protein